jgi:hypothetical protein
LSSPSGFYGRADLTIRQFRVTALTDSSLQLLKARDGPADILETLGTFRDDASDRLIVAGDDDLFAFTDAFEQLAEPGLGLECSDCGHESPTD